MRIAIDAHVVDFILERPGLLEAICTKARIDGVRIITSHVIHDQLAATTDATRRAALLRVYEELPLEKVETEGFVMNVSRLGEARLADNVDDFRTGGRGGAHDALIATTASARADVLVTDDRRLVDRALAIGVRCSVWSTADFERHMHMHSG